MLCGFHSINGNFTSFYACGAGLQVVLCPYGLGANPSFVARPWRTRLQNFGLPAFGFMISFMIFHGHLHTFAQNASFEPTLQEQGLVPNALVSYIYTRPNCAAVWKAFSYDLQSPETEQALEGMTRLSWQAPATHWKVGQDGSRLWGEREMCWERGRWRNGEADCAAQRGIDSDLDLDVILMYLQALFVITLKNVSLILHCRCS